MFELKDDVTGLPLFETISITLVCSDCLKTDHPELCTHKLAEMPRWLSSKKMEVVKSLLSDDPAMLLRESMGVGADSTQKAFAARDITAFFARPHLTIKRDFYEVNDRDNTNHVIVAVDPAGGGSSQFAIASVCQLPNGSIAVCGMDTIRTRDVRETHRLVIDHIASCRKIKGLENSTIVLVLESNLAYEAQHILHSVQAAGLKKWVALQEGAGYSLGWLTTNERKEAMCLQLREALAVGKISFVDDFFSNTASVKLMKQNCEDEMRNFCILVEASKTPFGKCKKTYSGKVGGRNDDLMIALQLGLSGAKVFYSETRYSAFRPVNNAHVPVPT